MRLQKHAPIVAIVVGLLVLSCLTASAAQLTLLNWPQGAVGSNANSIWYRTPAGATYPAGTVTSENVFVGIVNVAIDGDLDNPQRMLCVDLFHNIYWGSPWDATIATDKPVGVQSPAAWSQVAKLADTYINTPSGDTSARLQALVWEIIRDNPTTTDVGVLKSGMTGGDGLMTDNFRLTGTPAWLTGTGATSLSSMWSTAQNAGLNYANGRQYWKASRPSPDGQDMMFLVGAPSAPPLIPELPVAVLAPLGLAAIGLMRRRLLA